MVQIRLGFWPLFALLICGAIFFSLLLFVLDAPLPSDWDEALYYNRAYLDHHAYLQGGVRKLLSVLRYEDPHRPPAYRMFVLPYNLMFGVHPLGLKMHGLIFWAATLWLVFLTGRLLAGANTGAFAVLFLGICPMIVYTAKKFFTEYIFYFSIALTLLTVIHMMKSERPRFLHWAGLVFCVVLGGMAKLSFFFILAPLVLVLLVLGIRDFKATPRPFFLITSLAFGGLLLLPWWGENWAFVLDYMTHTAMTFERHSLGPGFSVGKLWNWMKLLWWTVLGPAASLIFFIFLTAFSLQFKRFDSFQKKAIWLLLLSAVPTLFLTFYGTNNNPRFVAPAFFPVALALAVIASVTGWLTSWKRSFILAGLILWQCLVMVWPSPGYVRYQEGNDSKTLLVANYTNLFRRPDNWDWEPFWRLTSDHGFERPVIGILGNGLSFSPPQVSLPWARRNLVPDVRLLWRYEMKSLDWESLVEAAAQCDVIVTVPGFVGKIANKNHLDNQYNTEFAERLAKDPRFEGPVHLKVGKFEFVELTVFFVRGKIDAP